MVATIERDNDLKRIQISILKDILATLTKIGELQKEIEMRRKAHPHLKGIPQMQNMTAILRAEEDLRSYRYLVEEI
jgi:hypothetical protein